MPGIPGATPYMIPGQAQIYPQGPPPTYDQALTHPAIVGQPVQKKQFLHFFLRNLQIANATALAQWRSLDMYLNLPLL